MLQMLFFFFFQAEDGIRDIGVTGVQTCALPIWKGLKFCYPSATKVGNKQNQYILNHLDFNMECGKAIGLIGLNGTGKTTFARVISGLEKIKEGKIWAEKDKELNRSEEHTSELQSRQYLVC